MPIATLNQNKQTRLLCLGDAQIKRSKEKFCYNREVPRQEASSEVLEPTVAPPPPPPNRGQQRGTGYKPLCANHQGLPGGEPLGCPLVSALG